MISPGKAGFLGWARTAAALWFIAFGVVALTVLRTNPRRYRLALGIGVFAVPGLIAAVSIGRKTA